MSHPGTATDGPAGTSECRIPGERGFAAPARLVREGIAIDRKIDDTLGCLAEGDLDHGG